MKNKVSEVNQVNMQQLNSGILEASHMSSLNE